MSVPSRDIPCFAAGRHVRRQPWVLGSGGGMATDHLAGAGDAAPRSWPAALNLLGPLARSLARLLVFYARTVGRCFAEAGSTVSRLICRSDAASFGLCQGTALRFRLCTSVNATGALVGRDGDGRSRGDRWPTRDGAGAGLLTALCVCFSRLLMSSSTVGGHTLRYENRQLIALGRRDHLLSRIENCIYPAQGFTRRK
jgi:hypothetical protein